ncbi:hypothetical protein BCBD1442_24410 [Brucella ceti]|nr:hypothetical protein BCBD1442_24410 [Brucella ceti]
MVADLRMEWIIRLHMVEALRRYKAFARRRHAKINEAMPEQLATEAAAGPRLYCAVVSRNIRRLNGHSSHLELWLGPVGFRKLAVGEPNLLSRLKLAETAMGSEAYIRSGATIAGWTSPGRYPIFHL